MTNQYKTRYPGLRVRKQPTLDAAIIGMLREGATIDAEHNVTVGANIWHALGVSAGGSALRASDDITQPGIVYAAHIYDGTQFTDEIVATPPPPVVTGKTRLGVNVVTGNGDVARRAIAAGCNAVSIVNNFQLAADLANDPKITVMARRYVSSMPPPDPDLLFEGAASPNVVYLTPLNECDVICYGSPEEIARRAAFDRDMWHKMRAKGRTPGDLLGRSGAEMTAQEITGIVGALGFPIVLVGGMLWFFASKVWPWYTKRTEDNDAARAKREESYAAQVAQTGNVYERVIAVLDRMATKLDSQHVEVMHEIRSLRGKTYTEPDRNR